MRKLIVTNIVSLDGYYEGPGKDVMQLPMDHAFDAYNAERLRAADTLLLGRSTFRLFEGFWPGLRDRADAPPLHREIARLNTAMSKLVVSDSLEEEQTGAWGASSQVVRRAAVCERLTQLKRKPGKDVLVFGSRTLWNALLAAGLVDEIHLMIGPVALAGGTPLFDAQVRTLRLLDTRIWEGSSNLLVRYTIER